ncbi:MAG: response regulator transcription factor [Chloroflexi bacterium]|nr:response regulator transcription factor [Chloroflexota bacterium]
MTSDTRATVLIVDDEPSILELVATRLEMAGYNTIRAERGEHALRLIFARPPDLALVDIDMPGMDGITLCKRIREVSNLPVIFLTAMGTEIERVHGLEIGADDYIVKPFAPAELIARVGAALRRAALPPVRPAEDHYADTQLVVNHAAHTVTVRGVPVSLSPLEYRLLAALVRHPGQVLSHDRLLDLAWGPDSLDASPESVRLYVSYLRAKIEEDRRRPRLIQTVREFGYRYVRPGSGAQYSAA